MASAERFPPTRAAGLARLDQFVPIAGRSYRSGRNFDVGPESHPHVSGLSPYLRHRLLSEAEVIDAVLGTHTLAQADKFVQEVFWRTYWKGWLEHRPSVWQDYLAGLQVDQAALNDDAGLREAYEAGVSGRTGIEPFDAWVAELLSTGYVHNHARMWFASLWIFTLRLPWRLGADFFLRHLLDGDPASNTLSWRWVAGLHTRGKTYLATPSNLRKYASKRFFSSGDPAGLHRFATGAVAPHEPPPPGAVPPDLPPDLRQSERPTGRIGLLLSEEDLLLDAPFEPDAVAALSPRHDLQPEFGEAVWAFKERAIADALAGARERWRSAEVREQPATADELVGWAMAESLDQMWLAYVPVGFNRDLVPELGERLARAGCSLRVFVRDFDRAAWPHATKGFFQLRKAIPGLLRESGPQGELFAV